MDYLKAVNYSELCFSYKKEPLGRTDKVKTVHMGSTRESGARGVADPTRQITERDRKQRQENKSTMTEATNVTPH